MTFFNSHLELDSLELHILNRLPDYQAEVIEEHLLICDKCVLMRNALEEQIDLICTALAA